MDMTIPTLQMKIVLESNPLKSTMLVGGLGVRYATLGYGAKSKSKNSSSNIPVAAVGPGSIPRERSARSGMMFMVGVHSMHSKLQSLAYSQIRIRYVHLEVSTALFALLSTTPWAKVFALCIMLYTLRIMLSTLFICCSH